MAREFAEIREVVREQGITIGAAADAFERASKPANSRRTSPAQLPPSRHAPVIGTE